MENKNLLGRQNPVQNPKKPQNLETNTDNEDLPKQVIQLCQILPHIPKQNESGTQFINAKSYYDCPLNANELYGSSYETEKIKIEEKRKRCQEKSATCLRILNTVILCIFIFGITGLLIFTMDFHYSKKDISLKTISNSLKQMAMNLDTSPIIDVQLINQGNPCPLGYEKHLIGKGPEAEKVANAKENGSNQELIEIGVSDCSNVFSVDKMEDIIVIITVIYFV